MKRLLKVEISALFEIYNKAVTIRMSNYSSDKFVFVPRNTIYNAEDRDLFTISFAEIDGKIYLHRSLIKLSSAPIYNFELVYSDGVKYIYDEMLAALDKVLLKITDIKDLYVWFSEYLKGKTIDIYYTDDAPNGKEKHSFTIDKLESKVELSLNKEMICCVKKEEDDNIVSEFKYPSYIDSMDSDNKDKLDRVVERFYTSARRYLLDIEYNSLDSIDTFADSIPTVEIYK